MAAGVVLAAGFMPVAAQGVEITLAPAPITSYLEDGKGTTRIKATSLTIDAAGSGMSGGGLDFVGRRRNGDLGLNAGMSISNLESDTGSFSMLSSNYMLGAEYYLGSAAILFVDLTMGSMDTTMDIPTYYGTYLSTRTVYSTIDTSGVNYGFQFTFGDPKGISLTPYYMVVSQTVSPPAGPEITVDSSVLGLDIMFDSVSLTALMQNSDNTSVTMISLGMEF